MAAVHRVCAACHTPVPIGAAFCSACGAPTPTESRDEFGGDFQEQVRAALADRYRIERELGRGGMAIVYLAEDLRHERHVALKILRPEISAAVGAERFIREIKLAARLNHPHILALYDSGRAGGPAGRRADGASEEPPARPPAHPPAELLFYVMPYVEGESLRAKLQRERQLPIDEALRLTREVAEGLDYAHQEGVIHRDIKPENILLAQGHALIADFGIAKAIAREGATNLTSAGTSIGTPLYMSPEQAAADPAMDGRADIYSLGCVLYEMLTGEPPFLGSTAHAILAKHAIDPRPSSRTVRDTVSENVDLAVQRAMAKVPADRFSTGAAFVSALRQSPPAFVREAPPVSVTGGDVSPAVMRPLRRFRIVLAAMVLTAITGMAVDVWLGPGVGPGPFVIMAALLVVGIEYGRLRLAGHDWRAAFGFDRSTVGVPHARARHSGEWVSGEQEFGAYAEQVRRARAHRAAIVGLMAQLPRSEQEMLGDVLAVADQLTLAIASSARALRQIAMRAPTVDTPSERETREHRGADLERELARTLGSLENVRDELRRVGRQGVTAAGPSLSRVLDAARENAR